MDYPLENLGPERFQQICQSLLTKEFPDVQCFPVAQPDGGRDSIAYFPSYQRDQFIVFQVKFVRRPQAEQEPQRWMVEVAEKESSKIRKLIPKGAKAFYLITNVSGTSHLEVGSIDKMQEVLSEAIGVPSVCWWRDDINRRLDDAWNLKWIYPELMVGPDLIRSIIESGLTENKEQRTAAIRAFVRDQYDIDQEVRFKQVELQNRLLDLFIDVPVTFGHQSARHKQYYYNQLLQIVAQEVPAIEETEADNFKMTSESGSVQEYYYREGRSVGAASLLLHPIGQGNIARMVLEGAPGQGKSTIAQYICQVHRMRLLNREVELASLPAHHSSVPVRIPFKVDLRDLATWLGKKDPFSAEDTEAPIPHWRKSLEAFLAAQVRHHSGGANFTFEDLIAVAKLSSLLLVFDGLDEIADITRRQEVVDEIIKGVNRLEENAASLQVIVTSRPAAFANSPGLPDDAFPYFQLNAVTRSLINEYAGNWLRARKIQGRQSSEFRNILKEKLDQPHLRDLARNPMQLAILLSLIHTRGSSLPDKRTALYDSYIELFFSREAEKSPVVREHRDLLIDIHRYLAWVLHSEAEQGHDRGSITVERLKEILSSYLTLEGHDPALSSKLFTGMVERVVALVSRVEGTFEFEVQPLREYFAARFLYETAPYSPPGGEQRGTKPDRFDAIAKDFYWLNVTRFYAGCFSKGELASLVDRLQELVQEEGYRFTSHPRMLAATLLSDWVFTQHPRSVREVVSLVLDGIGLRYVLSAKGGTPRSASPLVLPKKCGNDELLQRCFSLLSTAPAHDYAMEIVDLIKANASVSEIQELWLKEARVGEALRPNWFEYGLNLGALSQVSLEDLEGLLHGESHEPKIWNLLLRARRIDYCEKSEDNFNAVIDAILSRHIVPQRGRRPPSVVELLSHALDAHRYSSAYYFRQPVPLFELWGKHPRANFAAFKTDSIVNLPEYEAVGKCLEVARVAESEAKRPAIDWATELQPWDNLVESSRRFWGENWVNGYLANVAAGIKSSKETCVDFPELLDHSKSLCRRVRYARLRAGSSNWWTKQIEMAETQPDLMLTALILLTWGSAGTLVGLSEQIASLLGRLTLGNWYRVIRSVESSVFAVHDELRNGLLSFDLSSLPENLTERAATAIGIRAKKEERYAFYKRYLANYQGDDRMTLEFCQEEALDPKNLLSPAWHPNLDLVARSYAEGVISDRSTFRRVAPRHLRRSPIRVAEQIAKNADKFPSYLVAFAEATCRESVAAKIIAVGKIAQKDGWFTE
ncbi:MAG TPA: hypothetical protein VJU86_15760 [Pyrinomonadaceae bacterium]|nr:hypothetical protein [Pyrinomonadaceae bacterium]